jgi:hypothetical protein
LAKAEYAKFPTFDLNIPKHIPGIPDEILDPAQAWSDPQLFRAELKKLAGLFNQVRYTLSVRPVLYLVPDDAQRGMERPLKSTVLTLAPKWLRWHQSHRRTKFTYTRQNGSLCFRVNSQTHHDNQSSYLYPREVGAMCVRR